MSKFQFSWSGEYNPNERAPQSICDKKVSCIHKMLLIVDHFQEIESHFKYDDAQIKWQF